MKAYVIITDIIPIDWKNRRITHLHVAPILLSLPHFKKFYDLKMSILKAEMPDIARLDFFYLTIDSPYLN